MKLSEYLKKHDISPKEFAFKKAKLDPNTIYKALKGIRVRIDTAKRIVRATKKEVTLEDLGYGP